MCIMYMYICICSLVLHLKKRGKKNKIYILIKSGVGTSVSLLSIKRQAASFHFIMPCSLI